MARRGRKKHRTRDNNSIPRQSLRFDNYFAPNHWVDPLEDFDSAEIRRIDDRRQYNPGTRLGVFAESGRSTAKRDSGNYGRKFNSVTAVVEVGDPETTSFCEKRRVRREAMFATKRAGKSGQQRPRWNEESYLSCRKKK